MPVENLPAIVRDCRLTVILLGMLCPLVCLSADSPSVRVGISEFAENSVNLPIIPATVRLLEQTLGKENIITRTYSVANLQAAAKSGQVDVILSSAGTYRRLSIEGAGVSNIAAVVSERAPNPNFADGSVFFVRADRTDIRTIDGLKGKIVAATHRYAFSGWQTAMGELLRRGHNPEGFFKDVHFVGHDMPLVVKAVVDGETDAGIVRACFLEDMAVDTSRFRILNPIAPDEQINCVRSTALYPNWTISTTPSTSPETSRRIAAALLAMPPIENGLHWSLATDFRPIDRLFLDLKIGPYEYLRKFSLTRFISENSLFFTVFFTLLFGLILHAVTVTGLVKKRTRALEESMERERALEEEARLAQERVTSIQKVGIVGQMSSIIAHELRQPLSSISMHCYGLLRRYENGTDTRDVTVESVEKIAEQTKRASAIVDRVRAYAKGSRERSLISLHDAVTAGLENTRKSRRRSGVAIDFVDRCAAMVRIEANPLEIELIVVNLLKNAVDAVSGLPDARVTLTLEPVGRQIRLTVTDNGLPMSDENWHAIQSEAVRTTKDAGTGLGLSIVRSITEDLGGRTEFVRQEKGGLSVSVYLDAADTEGIAA